MATAGSSHDTQLDLFVDLSVLLTGFSRAVLAPPLDPIDLKTLYFETAKQQLGKDLEQLLGTYQHLVSQHGEDDESIANGLLGLDGAAPNASVVAAAQAINSLWYLGSWYAPDGSSSFVVSSQSYTGGLAWRALQSHAMGNSTSLFGEWAKEPPPLSAFTGNARSDVTQEDDGTNGGAS